MTTSVGVSPEITATLPLVLDEYGNELNPVHPGGSGTTDARGFDPLGVAYGITDWLDIGASFSRGLHGTVRVVTVEDWAISVSPAVFRYSSTRGGGSSGLGLHEGAVTNLNVSGVVSFYPQLLNDGRLELYGGGAINRYSGWVRSEVWQVDGSATVPSVIAGFRLGRFPEVTTSTLSARRSALVSIGLEVMGAWLRERGSATTLVPGGRLYLSIGGLVR